MRFGYPHTGLDYQFHMTLSGEMDGIANVAQALNADCNATSATLS
jgi:Protein of unknown function (DUF1045)